MDGMEKLLQNDCSLNGTAALNLPLPYPMVRVQEENQFYANLLSVC